MSVQSNIRPGVWLLGLSTLGIAAGAWKADFSETRKTDIDFQRDRDGLFVG